ncbi:MAG: MvaI/BcnI family restriction endonuclease [Bacteroidetes bacterium]|nr:MvaI/BcnI family restriction endonuclease [Bacteroidota bacterium]
MTDTNKIIKEFLRIKKMGFVASNRPNNKDGGIGNTFEDYLGVQENNLKDPDFETFEVKTQRYLTSSYITLFSKTPSHPAGANSLLKERFGDVRDPEFPDLKKLYCSLFGNRSSRVYERFDMKIELDRKSQKLYLISKDINTGEVYNDVYWNLIDLEKGSRKMKDLFVVSADKKIINGIHHYHYNSAIIYLGFNFKSLLDQIEEGGIQFDIRIGVHKSGKNYGKPHDHGSGFRIRKENLKKLFSHSQHIQ